ncbi:MAG TPA: hypothetical protein VGO55_01695 [Allosphingosinicella sp.]|jgi:hypothetical protein|nr:hypothetical protein [Allosphingosinicella sp.]
MIGPLALAAIAAAQPAAPAAAPAPPAQRERLPREVIFARARQNGWRLEAKTEVDDVGGFPIIENAYCEIKRSGLAITTWGDSGLWVRFGDTSVEPGLGFRDRHMKRIALDNVVWDYRWSPSSYDRSHFRNVIYPPLPDPCGGRRGHDIILYGCGGNVTSFSQGIRRRAGRPWLAPELLGNEFLGARRLRIGFQDPDGDGRGPMLWAEIPLTGLREAIRWCRGALASEGARRFHGGLEEE